MYAHGTTTATPTWAVRELHKLSPEARGRVLDQMVVRRAAANLAGRAYSRPMYSAIVNDYEAREDR